MDFDTAIKNCFVKYFSIHGRACRGEFWWFVLFTYFMSAFALFVDSVFLSYLYYEGDVYYHDGLSLMGGIWQCALLIPLSTVAIRRLHDVNRSGWWMLFIATGVGLIPLVLAWVRNSDKGDNDYGAEPETMDDFEENTIS